MQKTIYIFNNKKTLKKCFLVVLFLVFFCGAFAQSTLELLAKVSANYKNQATLSLHLTVYIWNKGAKTLVGEGQIKQKGNHYYSKFLHDEFLKNDSDLIFVNHNTKTIQIARWRAQENKEKQDKDMLEYLKSSVETKDSVTSIVNADSTYKITIYHASGLYSQTELYISKEYQIQKMKMFYRETIDEELNAEADAVEVVYILKNEVLTDETFSKKNIFLLSNNRIMPVGKYKDFKIIK